MTKKQAERYAYLIRALDNLGVSKEDADALLRIERTLHRWAERECNGDVETDESGKAWRLGGHRDFRGPTSPRWPTPNREAGALRRLAAIMARYPALAAYHQTDPRGCALYLYRRDLFADYRNRNARSNPDGSTSMVGIDCCYSSVGVAVCYT